MKADPYFEESMTRVKDMTQEELSDALAMCSSEVRAKLAEGPLGWRWDCGVCEAFGYPWIRSQAKIEGNEDPAWLAFCYHEVPKLYMTHRDQLHYGPLANDVYQRCLDTYRAAGWTGQATDPDA